MPFTIFQIFMHWKIFIEGVSRLIKHLWAYYGIGWPQKSVVRYVCLYLSIEIILSNASDFDPITIHFNCIWNFCSENTYKLASVAKEN